LIPVSSIRDFNRKYSASIFLLRARLKKMNSQMLMKLSAIVGLLIVGTLADVSHLGIKNRMTFKINLDLCEGFGIVRTQYMNVVNVCIDSK
jgi:hypothetical protein